MHKMSFSKELYSKIALMKAAYNFTDIAYIHLDSDEQRFYVTLTPKEPRQTINEQDFVNEMLTQSIRHEIYQETKDIRTLLLARAMATSVIADPQLPETSDDSFDESDVLKDWFDTHD